MSLIEKYSYNIDTVKEGDKIALICNHNRCKRFIIAIVYDPSTMQCYVPSYKCNYDMRNQLYFCHQHKIK